VIDSTLASRWRSWAPHLLALLRIVTAFLFMQVGSAKLFAFPAAIMPDGATAPVGSLAGVAGVLEVFGGAFILLGLFTRPVAFLLSGEMAEVFWGAFILLGLFTRPVAFLLSGEMAVAYFYGHAPQGFWPVLNGGAPAALYCFLFLYLSAAGAGPWSVDARLRRRREAGRGPAARPI
jgi:putative oxidoreductase